MTGPFDELTELLMEYEEAMEIGDFDLAEELELEMEEMEARNG